MTLYLWSKTAFIYRISGLDPSLNGLNTEALNADVLISLNEGDAKFVDIIHTDSGFHGTTERAGTVEFWPNYGHRYQPGCSVANLYNPKQSQNGIKYDLLKSISKECVI